MNQISAVTGQHVRDVLRQLYYDRTPGPTPLAALTVVQRSLNRAGFRPTDAACRYEVGRLITEIVESELAAWRRKLGVATGPGLVDPREQIGADFEPGHRELESWSAVYFLCLRPDIDLGLQDLVELLPYRHRRTVQRRLHRGVDALTAQLAAMERAAVLAERRDRLLGCLPRPPENRLFGMDPLLDRLVPAGAEGLRAPMIALGGPGGVGKTALAWRLAERTIDAGGVDDVTWIAAGSRTGLADGPEIHPTRGQQRHLVVVDALDDPEVAGAIVRSLTAVAPSAQIILTGRIGWASWSGVRVVQVPLLREATAYELLRYEAHQRGLDAVAQAQAQTVAPLLAATAGHPLAIRLAVAQLRAADLATVTADFALGRGVAAGLYNDLWAPVWARTSPAVRAAVRRIIGGRAADAADPELLREAVDAGILIPEGVQRRTYRPPLFLRRFLALVGERD
jgi:hypothetical protein